MGDEESSIAELRMSEGTGRFSKKVVAALSVGATLLLAPAAFYGGVAYGSHSTMPQSAAMDLVVEKDVIESEPSSRTMLACFLATIGRSSATSPRSCPRPSVQELSPPTRSMASSSGKTRKITTSTRPCFTKPGNCSRLTAGGRPCLGQ